MNTIVHMHIIMNECLHARVPSICMNMHLLTSNYINFLSSKNIPYIDYLCNPERPAKTQKPYKLYHLRKYDHGSAPFIINVTTQPKGCLFQRSLRPLPTAQHPCLLSFYLCLKRQFHGSVPEFFSGGDQLYYHSHG